MLLTIQAELSPGADLGYLLHKHPERHFCAEQPVGRVHVFFPEIGPDSATAALWLEVDPVGLVRRRKEGEGPSIDQYVNDRPYVASSQLSVAISRCLGTALNGKCQDRPDLAQTPLGLKVTVAVIASRGGPAMIERLFAPLGYAVEAERHGLDSEFPDWGESPYYTLRLAAHKPLSELLNHLYVLLPVLDRHKHYWIDKDEVEKLLRRGEGWLAKHPEHELITRLYLQERPSLMRLAFERLLPESPEQAQEAEAAEAELEKPLSLNEQRIRAVVELLAESGVQAVVDLGCGEGRVLKRLLQDTRIPRLIGVDVATRELERAERRLLPEWLAERQRQRLSLIQGSVLYRDSRYKDVDAALLIEVIEHLELFQLERLSKTLFGEQRPPLVVVTTPNREYNVKFSLAAHQLRHSDHRFEWTRQEFHRWAALTAQTYGYVFESRAIGEVDAALGPPTQMAIFSRQEAEL